jgi:hypothetical protein
MNQEVPPQSSSRGNFLALFLAAFAEFGFIIFLILISGGLFLDMILVAGGVVALAVVNYLLWGRSFNRDMAGEREEEQLRRLMEEDEPTFNERRPRRS